MILENDFLMLGNNRYFLLLEIHSLLSFSNIKNELLILEKLFLILAIEFVILENSCYFLILENEFLTFGKECLILENDFLILKNIINFLY